MIRYCLLFLLCVSLAACETLPPPPITPVPTIPLPTSTIPLDSGIHGQVLVGPACPGPQRLDATECADRPLQASITVTDLNGKFITKFTSGEDERFEIPLEPGDYILHPVPGDPYPRASELKVTVPAGEYIEVMIQYDSGLR